MRYPLHEVAPLRRSCLRKIARRAVFLSSHQEYLLVGRERGVVGCLVVWLFGRFVIRDL